MNNIVLRVTEIRDTRLNPDRTQAVVNRLSSNGDRSERSEGTLRLMRSSVSVQWELDLT